MSDEARPLGWILSRAHTPGINLKGEVPSATWRFLLPTPYPQRVVIAGATPDASAFERQDVEVVTVEPTEASVRAAVQRYRPGLVVAIRQRQLSDDALRHAVESIDACAYVERRRRPASMDAMHLAPAFGDVQVAVPNRMQSTWEGLLTAGIDPTSLRTAHLMRLRRRLRRGAPRVTAVSGVNSRVAVPRAGSSRVRQAVRGLVAASAAVERAARRHTSLAVRSAQVYGTPPMVTPGPPRYIRDLAGEDLRDTPWWFEATGAYRSQKLIVRVDLPGVPGRLIVKVGRDTWSSERLEHAADGLAHLARRVARVAPPLRFGGWHGDSFVAGETLEEGRPFERASDGSAACPWAANVVATLGDLAADTLLPTPDIAPALAALAGAFGEAYSTAGDEPEAVRRAARTISNMGRPLPSVVQHGDPGTWNIVARSDGTVALLDWENWEEHGVPLFDLILFLHGYALHHDRMRGVDAHRTVVARHFSGSSMLAHLIATSLRAAASRCGIRPDVVPHLVTLALAYQALKELPRLPLGGADEGVWFAELRAWLATGADTWLAGAVGGADPDSAGSGASGNDLS